MSLLTANKLKLTKNNANITVISTILRHNNYRQLTALQPHAPTVTYARWQRLPTEVSGCGQLAGGLKVGRRYKCVATYVETYSSWRCCYRAIRGARYASEKPR